MTYFVFSLVLVSLYLVFNYIAEKPTKKSSWALVIGIGLVLGGVFHLVNYFNIPTLAYDCWPVYIELVAFAAVSILITSLRVSDGDTGLELDNKAIRHTFFGGLVGVGLLGGAALYTWDNFHTQFQQSLLKVEEVKKGGDILSPIPVEEMCTVSPQVAQRILLTKMGDLKNTYELGELTKQSFTGEFDATTNNGQNVHISYNNHLVYVGVLEHKGFWTWYKQPWTPAIVLVDATDENKAYVLTSINGEPLQVRYTEGANFNSNLERHLRQNGYATDILDDFNIELDENGRPFAPVTTMKHIVGMSTPDVTGVAVVDVQTGEIKHYTPESAPKFVNRIYPESIVYERLYTWGDYKNGYFHWSDKNGLLQACEGMDIVQTKEGCYYYVGVQAQSDSVGTQGYMLIDIRTGKAKYYHRNGISEKEALRVLEANTDLNVQMSQGVLSLTEPIFYNVEGLKTYFATYVSTKDFTVKYFGFCSADDKDVWGYGTTLEEAKASYLASFYKEQAQKTATFTTAEKQSVVTLSANVLEKVQEGNAYYFRLEGQEGKTFYAYSSITPEVRWKSNKIKITFNKTDAKLIAISSYKALD